uniref:CRM-domain containing factor CFM3, chloroplastic/mitochondrial n=1 Tax=Anthurium amnicola TaxID=1678845 RepID=A0A1D1YQQ7_9ARAE
MALSPSMSLGLFPSPSPPVVASLSSLSIPVLRIRGRAPGAHSTSPRLHASRSSHTLQLPHEERLEAEPRSGAGTTRKKRKKKPRPNFYEQTMERWSARISSQRSRFPWQERGVEEVEGEGEVEGEEDGPSSPVVAEDGPSQRARSPIHYPLGNRTVSAPWSHGSESTGAGSEAGAMSPSKSSALQREGKVRRPGSALPKIPTFRSGNSKDGHHSTDSGGRGNSNPEGGPGYPSLHTDEIPLVGEPLGFPSESLGASVSLGHDMRLGSMDSETETWIPWNSPETTGEGQSSMIGSVLRTLESSYKQNSSDLNAGSDDEEESYSVGGNSDSLSLPWERDSVNRDGASLHRRSNTELAEKTIPEPELRRLRNLALRMKERTKVGAIGVTEALVEGIHRKWKEVEVVKLKFEGPPALHMKTTHNILERRTGGIVIWRSGSSLALYRGMTYGLPCLQSYSMHSDSMMILAPSSEDSTIVSDEDQVTGSIRLSKSSDTISLTCSEDSSDGPLDKLDIDSLLDELGPRFRDWSGRDPLPVDADLLSAVVPGYKPPFRLLPYKTKHGLRNGEMTYLRRLARTMPPHFALGRNRLLQGLAQAIIKLWERSIIAKIAIKRGVQNSCNERMAEEIKKLTGGVLLSRNKEYVVLYRGNDFLVPSITEVLSERQNLANVKHDEEEQARMLASAFISSSSKASKGPLVAGTLAETLEAKTRWGNQTADEEREKMMKEVALGRHASHIRFLGKKLALAKEKVHKAEKALAKVQEFLSPAELPTDLETVTDEERFLYRKIGLKMKPLLFLGRRGVFDGTVENMHLNWKHRELVKIVVKGISFAQVKHAAISLEAESGGILISLDKTTKGYAIIIYRGKNYRRPHVLRPKNLLTRRQALARSIELQRREALNHHIFNLREKIEMLKSELEHMKTVKGDQEDTYSHVDDSFLSDDDDAEVNNKTVFHAI